MIKKPNRNGFSALIAVIIVAVVALAGAGAWFSMKKSQTIAPSPSGTSMNPSGSAGGNNTIPSIVPSMSAGTSASLTVSGGTSDADLDKDSQDVSTKLNSVNNDSVTIDQGINDKQGNLSEQ